MMRMRYKREISVILLLTASIVVITILNRQHDTSMILQQQRAYNSNLSEKTQQYMLNKKQKTREIKPEDILVISGVTSYPDEIFTTEDTTTLQVELNDDEKHVETEIKDTTPNSRPEVKAGTLTGTEAQPAMPTPARTQSKPGILALQQWSEKDMADWGESFNITMRQVTEHGQLVYRQCFNESKPRECFLRNNQFWPNRTNNVKHAGKGKSDNDVCASSKKLVILHSYERTGSCYFGSLIKDNPGVFYLFEPYRLQEQIYHKMTYPRPTYLDPADIKEEVQTLSDYRTCNLKNIIAFGDPILKEPRLNFYISYNIHDFLECIIRYHSPKPPANLTRSQQLDKCYETATDACMNTTRTKILLTKTVRGTMEGLAAFLASQTCTDNIKVVHLVRDPRGMFNSLYKANWSGLKKLNIKDLTSEIDKMCSRMLKDILIRKDLEKIYPNMFMQLRYEELTKYTAKTMIDVYNFMEEYLEFDSLVDIIVHSGYPNTTKKPYKWQEDHTIMAAFTKIIDEQCYPLYAETGYLPVTENVINRPLTWEDAYNLVIQDENVEKMFANSLL